MKLSVHRFSYQGFTLIELLVVVAIVAVLASLLLPTLHKSKERARFINEINTAKQLMLAHRMYADDNGGMVFPGYRYGFPAKGRSGQSLSHPINARYPWRIAPYLGMNFEILYVNRNRRLLHDFARDDDGRYTYAASIFPSMAVNSVFVGGDDLVLPPSELALQKFGRFCVLRESDAQRPSQLIAFLSARSTFNEKIVEGYYRSMPPYLADRQWPGQWDAQSRPETFGFVHPRYGRRTVTAMLDGHAESLGFDQIQDMRFWANQADRPDWTLTPR